MKSVGIDIGTSSVKLVEVLNTGKGVQIISFVEHVLDQSPGHDPVLEIIEFLQGFAVKYEGSPTNIVLGLRQERVSVRYKTFPFADRLKIIKSLPFELEEDLPFSSDTAIYDARITRMVGDQTEVLACVVPKHRIGETLEKYQSTDLQFSIFSAEGLAFANCFEPWWEPIKPLPAKPIALEGEVQTPRKLKLVIQLGHTHTIIAAFEDQRAVAVRSILWGGLSIAESIARKYEIPLIEAERELRNKAFILANKSSASYDQIVFSDTIAQQVRELGKELKLSILEIETELNGKIDTAEVTGGLSGIQSLTPFLTQVLEIPVNRAKLLDSYVVHFDKTPQIENSIGTALGLALEGLRKPRNPAIQFLRGEFARQNENLQIFWETWGRSLQVAAALVAVFFVFSFVRENLTESLLDQSGETLGEQAKVVAHLPTKMANETGIKKYIRDKRKHSQEMKALEGLSQMNSALDILRKITDAVPPRSNANLVLKFLRVEDQSVYMQGSVGSPAQKALLEKALTPLSKNGKLTPHTANQLPGEKGIAVGISFDIDRGIKAEASKAEPSNAEAKK